jgi:hypothetical protein
MKVDWRSKLSSRKFWALVAVLLSSNLFLFGVAESTITQITAVLTNLGSVVVYLLVEGTIDKHVVQQGNIEQQLHPEPVIPYEKK